MTLCDLATALVSHMELVRFGEKSSRLRRTAPGEAYELT